MRTVVDTTQPNLLRHIFPSYRVPRVSFAEGSLPVQVPQEAWCVETTLGQGVLALQQPPLELAGRFLDLVGGLNGQSALLRKVEIRVEGPVGRDILQLAIDRQARQESRLEPVAQLPTYPEAVAAVKGLGLAEAGLAIGVSDYQTHLGQPGSRTEALALLLGTMDACLAERIHPRLDLVDATRCDLDGFLLPLVETCLNHLARHGGSRLRIRLCDTLGVGLPWPEAPVPRSVPRMVHTIRHAMGLQPPQLEFLGANDLGLALPNALAAAMCGASGVACAMGGVAERGGIAPTELVLVHLSGLFGADCDLRVVPELLDLLRGLGLKLGGHHPLFGEQALTSSEPQSMRPLDEAAELYAPFDTGRLLQRPPRLELQPQSGAAGVAYLIREHVPGAAPVPGDERVRALHGWLGENGLREVAWERLAPKVQELMPELFEGEEAPGS